MKLLVTKIFDGEGDFMQQANAILKLNLTLLLKDKISLIWGLILPTITLLFNINNIQNSSVLVYWWVYIFLHHLYMVLDYML